MLTLRPEQLQKFSDAAVKRFEDGMVVHLKKFFPEECAALGEVKLRQLIQHGIVRARLYGVTGRRDVCNYIDIMLVFGANFDIDPNLPWARQLLTNARVTDPSARMRRLYAVAMDQQD